MTKYFECNCTILIGCKKNLIRKNVQIAETSDSLAKRKVSRCDATGDDGEQGEQRVCSRQAAGGGIVQPDVPGTADHHYIHYRGHGKWFCI